MTLLEAVVDLHALVSYPGASLVPALPPHVWERGSGVLNNFCCHSSPIWALELDCRTRNYMCWHHRARDLVCLQCKSAIVTFFTPFNPTPCDKKCRSEHQTLFPLYRRGVWACDYPGAAVRSDWKIQVTKHLKNSPPSTERGWLTVDCMLVLWITRFFLHKQLFHCSWRPNFLVNVISTNHIWK